MLLYRRRQYSDTIILIAETISQRECREEKKQYFNIFTLRVYSFMFLFDLILYGSKRLNMTSCIRARMHVVYNCRLCAMTIVCNWSRITKKKILRIFYLFFYFIYLFCLFIYLSYFRVRFCFYYLSRLKITASLQVTRKGSYERRVKLFFFFFFY